MRWIADDPDPATRASCSACSRRALAGDRRRRRRPADRMAGPLRFGTAGLRGPVRAGPNGMNVAVVRRDDRRARRAGCAHGPGAGRRSSSAATPATAPTRSPRPPPRCSPAPGSPCACCPARCPTPVLAFAVRQLGAVAGVQITASHNPPADNGYKVYLADGAQLAPPADAEIEAAIAAAPPGRLGARPARARRSSPTSREAYLDRVAPAPPRHRPRPADRAHPDARRRRRDRRARPARAPGSPTCTSCTAQAAPDAGVPDRRVPQPGGARRHRPAARAGRATSAPTSRSPSTPTPTGARSASRADGLADAHRRRDRRAARRPPPAHAAG